LAGSGVTFAMRGFAGACAPCSSRKVATAATRPWACSCMDSAAAAASSTSAAFCCVTSSICVIAVFTCSIPPDCSWEAAVISAMMSVTRFTLVTISPMVRPASSTSFEPASTLPTESSMSALISLAAAALRCARLRTSLATTAKPRPCSPARAASTAALSARMFVWKAIPSITPMMSAIFLDAADIPFIVATTSPTTAPPLTATSEAPAASWLACRAFSAFCLTVAVSSSIEEAVSSSELACSSVRCDRSALPWEISREAVSISSADSLIRVTIALNCSTVRLESSFNLPKVPA